MIRDRCLILEQPIKPIAIYEALLPGSHEHVLDRAHLYILHGRHGGSPASGLLGTIGLTQRSRTDHNRRVLSPYLGRHPWFSADFAYHCLPIFMALVLQASTASRTLAEPLAHS
jgi:hypothetical protein